MGLGNTLTGVSTLPGLGRASFLGGKAPSPWFCPQSPAQCLVGPTVSVCGRNEPISSPRQIISSHKKLFPLILMVSISHVFDPWRWLAGPMV